jgi:ATP-dependent exoDNAse (exonuclease V) beta subunit
MCGARGGAATARYGQDVARDSVWAAFETLMHELDAFQAAADADLAALLREELRGVIDGYKALKARAGALDFVDLLLRARDLIAGDAQVRRAFQARFTHLFVDEFQDTDPLQAELLLLLAANDPNEQNWRNVTPHPGKLFIVGDPKQAIYRFRRADVETYREVYELLKDRGARPVFLRTSFRAVPAIQRAVNAAFAPLMTGDRVTLQAEYVPLNASPLRDDRVEQPAVIALPVPEPYGMRRVAGYAIREIAARRGRRVRRLAAQRKRLDRHGTHAAPHAANARAGASAACRDPVPAISPLRRRCDPPLRRRARSARRIAPACRRQIVSRAGRGRNDPRRAGRHRVAGR